MTRWFAEWSERDRAAYASRFEKLAAAGHDIDGEARLVDALAARGSRILDAGCGAGRVAHALAVRGHDVLGVDADPGLIEAGRAQHPGLPLEHGDLLELTPEHGPFDLVVAAGNVLVYLEPGTERAVLAALAAVLRPGGRAVFGFATDRDYTLDALDADARAVGWALEHRFATWEADAWTDSADWAVSVFRA
ncbi:class I SAM-dependent methyltransferase [Nocardioides donggukensis]|uniref:Class I SAM-dependent methyltransferase n=1 Tax=Nocardioides donggukensis TaxID=2774019 RepID=A0A927K5G7_9ACTN|nr:class I SAM-dependent methyltransferase [Nocardioides donggukensis]MBD8868075.1 class I SAM-dependent methyltransferase [Nocardioides donggukensis]